MFYTKCFLILFLILIASTAQTTTSSASFGLYVRWASHWSDVDKDCQDTRQEVLIEESLIPVTFKTDKKCKVASGLWKCKYTGNFYSSPKDLDIDHFVPLKEAWRSGGWEWEKDRKKSYYNYLRAPEHLIAVDRGSNRSKKDKAPDKWLPPNEDFHCEYAVRWLMIKHQWDLSLRDEEKKTIGNIIMTKCLNQPVEESESEETPL